MLDFTFNIVGIDGTSQLLFNGLVTGLVFGLLAMGIVLVYRSTRVINIAVANMGLPASVLMAIMVVVYDFPYWIALLIAMVIGTLVGAIVELTIIRRLFHAPRVILLVATIGIAQLMQAIVSSYPDIDVEGRPRYPVPVGSRWDDVAGLRISGPQVTILVIVPLLAIALGWLMNRTLFGKTVQASAANADLARTSGISPRLVSTAVWTIAGLLATISALLLSGQQGSIAGFSSLGPNTLARALAAAVLAGMVSFRRALAAGVLIGMVQALVQFNYLDAAGLFDFLLFIGVAIAVYLQAKSDDESATFSFAPKSNPIPEVLQGVWWVRNLQRIAAIALFTCAALVPFFFDTPSKLIVYSTIVVYAICALSVTVVSGWAGQLSLGQMALAGLGAFSSAALVRAGLPFVVAILGGAACSAASAAVVGAGALRVRGLFLAVVTFTFGLAANQYLFRTELLSDGNRGAVPFKRGDLLAWSLDTERAYFWFVLALLAICLLTVATLRNSGVGRSIIAVRDNPESAAAYTVNPTRTRLMSFALSGAIAGLGGGALGSLLQQIPLQGRFFQPFESLRIVSMAVIGGLGSVIGPVFGALWVEGLRGLFPDNELVPLFTSSIGLLILLLYFPGGLVQIGFAARDALFRWLAARRPTLHTSRDDTVVVATRERATERKPATLAARDIAVTFGGNRAVDGASIHVDDGEIVGLIGTNGAGKSTLMNAIGGFVPTAGEVRLLGEEIGRRPAHQRAKAGLGRTFQAATLFPELTVLETVKVALESQSRTSLLGTSLHAPPARRAERAKTARAHELIDFLGLGRYASVHVSELSTGTRRIVELANLLALEARVLCLDEPTAGIAQRETEAFGPLLVRIREELDASILIIEHDMPMIMSISDRVYCLDQGAVIAQGTPDEVRNDPLVITTYLGTDNRAIDRSDT